MMARGWRLPVLGLSCAVSVVLGMGSAQALAAAPVVSTGAASNVQTTGQGTVNTTLNGTVVPNGPSNEINLCYFEYGETHAYGQTAECSQSREQIGSGFSPVPVSVDLNGLAPGTTYHFRLVIHNFVEEGGTFKGETYTGSDAEFTTPSSPPVILNESFSDVGSGSVILTAQLAAGGFASSYWFCLLYTSPSPRD